VLARGDHHRARRPVKHSHRVVAHQDATDQAATR
jgi:hypothetical protein